MLSRQDIYRGKFFHKVIASLTVIYIALGSISKQRQKILFNESVVNLSYFYSLWYTKKILVPNKEIVIVIHHL